MAVDNDQDARVGARRSPLVSRRTAAEISGLSLPQVDYWIRRGVIGSGDNRSRLRPRRRTDIDVLALLVAVELRGRGVPVREVQAVLPYVLAEGRDWHPMAELIDLDAMHERIRVASAKVTTSTVPALSAMAGESPDDPEDEQPTTRRRGWRIAAIAVAWVVAVSATALAIALLLPSSSSSGGDAPVAPAPPAVATPAPGPAPAADPAATAEPTARDSRPPAAVAPVVIPPSGVAETRPPASAPPADAAVQQTAPQAPVEGGAADDGAPAEQATTPETRPTPDRPSGGLLGGLGGLFGQ